jgi:rhamnosyl/mannosyltransferase
VSPGDTPALAAAIARLLDAPRLAARLGAGGREAIAQRFSIDRMVEATEQLYLELLARKEDPC